MSQENLDLVRSIFATWERGDYSSTEWADSGIEWVLADGPSPGKWSGLGGMADASREYLGAWEEARLEAEEYRELDDERVLVLVHQGARGRTSRLEVGARSAGLFYVRGGKVTRVVFYFDRDNALADLGLKE
jgi:ketosteroid isomerase-like protein